MAGMEGFEPSNQGVWSRILDLNQYTVETVFKLIHRILLELILESPLPYRLATPLYYSNFNFLSWWFRFAHPELPT